MSKSLRKREPLCHRLPSTSTKEARLAEHKTRMMERQVRYIRRRDEALHSGRDWLGRPKSRSAPIANLSAYHPDYGRTPAEHARLKEQRALGKVKYEPKEVRRARLGRLI